MNKTGKNAVKISCAVIITAMIVIGVTPRLTNFVPEVEKADSTVTNTYVADDETADAKTADAGSDEALGFYDDFDGDELDTDKWLVAKKAWGRNNGGVVPENVHISDGNLILTGHGDNYTGDITGVDRMGNSIDQKTRVGAAIATKDYYASGSYEIRAKIPSHIGGCCAMWTFEYEERYAGEERWDDDFKEYTPVNNEIDIELPGRPVSVSKDISYDYALCNTWLTDDEVSGDAVVTNAKYTCNYTSTKVYDPETGKTVDIDDGEFHTFRFDWHTAPEDGSEPRVDFYIDGIPAKTCTTNIPTIAGRFWVGLWYPDGWAGVPDYDEEEFVIDYVHITPFNESGDEVQNESYPDDGWASADE